jgi:hypothetical protein
MTPITIVSPNRDTVHALLAVNVKHADGTLESYGTEMWQGNCDGRACRDFESTHTAKNLDGLTFDVHVVDGDTVEYVFEAVNDGSDDDSQIWSQAASDIGETFDGLCGGAPFCSQFASMVASTISANFFDCDTLLVDTYNSLAGTDLLNSGSASNVVVTNPKPGGPTCSNGNYGTTISISTTQNDRDPFMLQMERNCPYDGGCVHAVYDVPRQQLSGNGIALIIPSTFPFSIGWRYLITFFAAYNAWPNPGHGSGMTSTYEIRKMPNNIQLYLTSNRYPCSQNPSCGEPLFYPKVDGPIAFTLPNDEFDYNIGIDAVAEFQVEGVWVSGNLKPNQTLLQNVDSIPNSAAYGLRSISKPLQRFLMPAQNLSRSPADGTSRSTISR